MTDADWTLAAQEYTRNLGKTEYESWSKRKHKKKSDRFIPSDYLVTLCRLIGKGDEESYKATKFVSGRYSALGF